MKNQIILITLMLLATTIVRAQSFREIPPNSIITPYKIEVSFDKTGHIIFPCAVQYIDLGSANIIAGKADAAKNVVRIKAAVKDFKNETNFSVITQSGSFYTFNVNYAQHPKQLSIEMKNNIVNHQNTALDVYLMELGNESPKTMNLVMQSIYDKNKKKIRGIKSKQFGMKQTLKNIYCHSDMLYLQTEISNETNINYDIDFIVFKIVDKKVAKQTAIQETIVKPVRIFNNIKTVKGKCSERTVFAFKKFTMSDDKHLIVELFEKNGGRHQSFVVKNKRLVKVEKFER